MPVVVGEVPNLKLAYSLPEYINTAIEYIEENNGTYEEYLLSCDISKEVLNKVRSKYLD